MSYIFFSSGGYTFSGIIIKLTRSVWSYVAIIYKDEIPGHVLVRDCFSTSEVTFGMKDIFISPRKIWVDDRVEFKYNILQ